MPSVHHMSKTGFLSITRTHAHTHTHTPYTTHQVKILARLAEKEALHAILLRLGRYIMKSCITAADECQKYKITVL